MRSNHLAASHIFFWNYKNSWDITKLIDISCYRFGDSLYVGIYCTPLHQIQSYIFTNITYFHEEDDKDKKNRADNSSCKLYRLYYIIYRLHL